jgi:hypothetical protein
MAGTDYCCISTKYSMNMPQERTQCKLESSAMEVLTTEEQYLAELGKTNLQEDSVQSSVKFLYVQ